MLVPRIVFALAMAAGVMVSSPASAQFFMKPMDLRGERVTGAEPGITGPALPDASPTELRAALIWNLRAALNVAALQCQFEPTLLTLSNYNALLRDHEGELKSSYDVLGKYFTRRAKNDKKVGLTELDRFGTRVYSGFSTVSAQLTFCSAASSIGHQALFAKPGALGDVAEIRMQELRKSLTPWGEQQFWGMQMNPNIPSERFPPFGNEQCWKKESYVEKKCGPFAVLPYRAALAQPQ